MSSSSAMDLFMDASKRHCRFSHCILEFVSKLDNFLLKSSSAICFSSMMFRKKPSYSLVESIIVQATILHITSKLIDPLVKFP